MTRRSFCFLFGAGIAAATLPLPSLATQVQPPNDAFTSILHSLNAPTTATFRTRDAAFRVGQTITVSMEGKSIFSGTIDQIVIADGSHEVRASDKVEFSVRQPDAWGVEYPL